MSPKQECGRNSEPVFSLTCLRAADSTKNAASETSRRNISIDACIARRLHFALSLSPLSGKSALKIAQGRAISCIFYETCVSLCVVRCLLLPFVAVGMSLCCMCDSKIQRKRRMQSSRLSSGWHTNTHREAHVNTSFVDATNRIPRHSAAVAPRLPKFTELGRRGNTSQVLSSRHHSKNKEAEIEQHFLFINATAMARIRSLGETHTSTSTDQACRAGKA